MSAPLDVLLECVNRQNCTSHKIAWPEYHDGRASGYGPHPDGDDARCAAAPDPWTSGRRSKAWEFAPRLSQTLASTGAGQCSFGLDFAVRRAEPLRSNAGQWGPPPWAF